MYLEKHYVPSLLTPHSEQNLEVSRTYGAPHSSQNFAGLVGYNTKLQSKLMKNVSVVTVKR